MSLLINSALQYHDVPHTQNSFPSILSTTMIMTISHTHKVSSFRSSHHLLCWFIPTLSLWCVIPNNSLSHPCCPIKHYTLSFSFHLSLMFTSLETFELCSNSNSYSLLLNNLLSMVGRILCSHSKLSVFGFKLFHYFS